MVEYYCKTNDDRFIGIILFDTKESDVDCILDMIGKGNVIEITKKEFDSNKNEAIVAPLGENGRYIGDLLHKSPDNDFVANGGAGFEN